VNVHQRTLLLAKTRQAHHSVAIVNDNVLVKLRNLNASRHVLLTS